MKLTDFRVISFDCYGTLIDWETGILAALEGLMNRAREVSGDEALEAFGRHEAALEATHPQLLYSNLLAQVYRGLAQDWGITVTDEEAETFGGSVGSWPAFPDSPEALQALKQRYVLVVLSNIDRASFSHSERRLGVEFDHVFTAEEIGSYKPSIANFEFMLDRLAAEGFGKGDILHTAQSLFHDHVPANACGLHSAWINRRQGRTSSGATPHPDPMPHVDFEFATLAEVAAAVS